jgi:hypothetical protein
MKCVKCMALISALTLLFPLSMWARNKSEHSVNISDSVQIGTTQLKPGTYKVEWQEAGPSVQVEFVQNGKTIATASGILKTNDSEVIQDDIVIQTSGANKKVLKEIDFSHQKEALVFG